MRLLYTSILLAMALRLPLYAEESVIFAQQEEWENSARLSDLTAHFSGPDALPVMRGLLEKGADPNKEDASGDTPLLLLCQSLELDYRYRNEPRYRNAVDQAIILLLQHKADVLHENKHGCNAMFYLQGKPELLKKLTDLKLLPPELAIRIPHEEMALLRYMRLRVQQADRTTNDGSRAYLVRRYCAPGFDRATKLLGKYLKAEMLRDIPANAMETTLAFMRLANPAAAEAYVNSLPLWEHSEHFLEEVPDHFLQSLAVLDWNVSPDLLRRALDRLDSLLPRNDSEIIDCNAAVPMCCLLIMLDRQSGETAPKELERYSRSRDNRLAYTALCLRLQRQGLPTPDPVSLMAAFNVEDGTAGLPEAQQRLLECAIVDSAIRHTDLSALDPDMLRRVSKYYVDLGLPAHAAILDEMVDEEGLAIGEAGLDLVEKEYSALPGPTPQVIMARYILNHPATFSPANGK